MGMDRCARLQPAHCASKAYSPLYFELVQQLTGLGPVLALGERVIVAGRAVAIEFTPTGQERMSDSDVRGVVAAW